MEGTVCIYIYIYIHTVYIPQKQTVRPNQHWWITGTILSLLFVCLNKQSLAILFAASDWFYWSVSSIAGPYLLVKWTIIKRVSLVLRLYEAICVKTSLVFPLKAQILTQWHYILSRFIWHVTWYNKSITTYGLFKYLWLQEVLVLQLPLPGSYS